MPKSKEASAIRVALTAKAPFISSCDNNNKIIKFASPNLKPGNKAEVGIKVSKYEKAKDATTSIEYKASLFVFIRSPQQLHGWANKLFAHHLLKFWCVYADLIFAVGFTYKYYTVFNNNSIMRKFDFTVLIK